MEIKRTKVEKQLDDDCDDAIDQIVKNANYKKLPEWYEHQLVYGIAFFGKTAKVKLMK